MSTEVTITDPGAWEAGMKSVRSDSDPSKWAVFGHENMDPSRVCFIASGQGGVEEFAQQFRDDGVFYGLLRLEQEIDMSMTVKFVYVHWVGEKVSFTKRGRFGVVSGSVRSLFGSIHVNVETNVVGDLTEQNIMKLLDETSGKTQMKVLDASEGIARPERGFTSSSAAKRPTANQYTSTNVQRVSSAGGTVDFDPAVAGIIANVRNDSTDTSWCLVTYKDDNLKKPFIESLGSGTGQVEEMTSLLKDNIVAYGLYRVTDVVDEIATVKFVYIQWVGTGVKPLSKAKISTHKGALEEMFYPTHVTIFASTQDEITHQNAMDKVMSASGSKSHVK